MCDVLHEGQHAHGDHQLVRAEVKAAFEAELVCAAVLQQQSNRAELCETASLQGTINVCISIIQELTLKWCLGWNCASLMYGAEDMTEKDIRANTTTNVRSRNMFAFVASQPTRMFSSSDS